MSQAPASDDAIAINEVQLILAEKRTSLAVLRTGIAVLALPLSITSFLIATSKYYEALQVLKWLIPLGILNASLVLIGFYLVIKSIRRLRQYDHQISELKRQHSLLKAFVD